MSTQRDVAKKAGVSRASVSNYINNKGYVGAEARTRIENAIQELNYQPNLLARGLKSRMTKTIGVLFRDVESSFSSTILHNIENIASAHGYSVNLCITGNDPQKEREYIQSLKDRFVDGFIIDPTHTLNTCHYDTLSNEYVVYLIHSTPPAQKNEAIIKLDNRLGVKLGLEYLIELGHRNIGIIRGPDTLTTNSERYDHLVDLMNEHNIPVQEIFIVTAPNFTEYYGYVKTKSLLHQGTLPTAIFSLCGGLSIGSLKAIRECALHIPNDISFISFDNSNYTEYLDPPLTTIMQPAAAFGTKAMTTLFNMIHGITQEDMVIELAPELIIRNSCARQVFASLQ